jgi:hypothetical protein
MLFWKEAAKTKVSLSHYIVGMEHSLGGLPNMSMYWISMASMEIL